MRGITPNQPLLLAVFGVFNVSIVLQFARFHSGNVKKTLLRPRFSSASTLLFSQRLSSLLINSEAFPEARASSDKSTQSHVRPRISPIRMEQPSARSIASFRTGFSQIASAYLTSLADHESRSFFTRCGSVTFSAGLMSIYLQPMAFLNAPLISA